MIKTLRITLSLRMTYIINAILYSLKQIPLVKKILPTTLYSVRELKLVASVFALLWELVSSVAGKLLYFSVMLFLPAKLNFYDGLPKDAVFLHIFVCLTAAGALMNTFLFNPTKDKYYAVILMGMDARENALVNYAYNMIKLFAGFWIFGTLFGTLLGVPWWMCLLMPFSAAGAKLIVTQVCLRRYERTKKGFNENLPTKYVWMSVGVLLLLGYGLPALSILLPLNASLLVMIVFVLAGLPCLGRVIRFPHYRVCYQQMFAESQALWEENKAGAFNRAMGQKMISDDTSFSSSKKGFAYLNEIFVKRHKKLLWSAAYKISVVCGVIFLGGCAVSLGFKFSGSDRNIISTLNQFLHQGLPLFVFIMYAINRGMSFTMVLFTNCDHCLLTYPFFKEPKNILRLFQLRLREIIKVNLLPASVIGAGLSLLLYCSGGTDAPLNYIIFPVTTMALSVFFSIHYLMLYYLFQPYNAGTEIKSAPYGIIRGLTYAVSYGLMQVKLSTFWFGVGAIAFCIIYTILSYILTYHLSPKTFRLRF